MKVLIVIIFGFVGVSCYEARGWEAVYPELVEKKIVIPESVTPYNKMAESYEYKEGGYTLINVVDANCNRCIGEMKRLQEIAGDEFYEYDINYIFIGVGEPNFYFKESVLSKKILQLPIYIDLQNGFIEENKIEQIANFHTILLDEADRIIYAGSPVFDEANILGIKKTLLSIRN